MITAIETVSISKLAAFIRRQTGVKGAAISSVHQALDPSRLFVELTVPITGTRRRAANAEVIVSPRGKPVELLEYYEEPDKKASRDWAAAGL